LTPTPELWVPGAVGPSLDDFVKRLHASIEAFAERRGWDKAHVEVELVDGAQFALHSIRPEPGYGFITICPYPEEDDERPWPKADDEVSSPPEELIVPVGSIKRFVLNDTEEQRAQFGFSVTPTS
jgi:hypothetical protein